MKQAADTSRFYLPELGAVGRAKGSERLLRGCCKGAVLLPKPLPRGARLELLFKPAELNDLSEKPKPEPLGEAKDPPEG